MSATDGQLQLSGPKLSPKRKGIGSSWALVYVVIALPTVIALCFLTQVFRSLDEPAHFLRVVQLSQGGLLPVLGPDQHSTGSYQSAGVARFTSFYGTRHKDFMRPEPKTSQAEIARLYEFQDQGPARFVEHSNTTIYFPTAYVSPMIGLILARQVSDRPLIWFYSARISSALASVALTALGLFWAGSFAPVLFVIAVTPIVMFQAAALSADGLLVASAIAAAGLVRVIISGQGLSKLQFVTLLVVCSLIGLSKFAYCPIALAPLLISILLREKYDRRVYILISVACVVLSVSVYWGHTVKPLTFTIRQDADADRVNVDDQLRFVIGKPLFFLYLVVKTAAFDSVRYAASFNGGILGWFDLKLPVIVPVLSATFLVANAVVGPVSRFSLTAFIAVSLASLASIGAIFFLLYLQWNKVGSDYISGVQGRYFIPLAPLTCACLPRWDRSDVMGHRLGIATRMWGVTSAVVTIAFVTVRYWRI